MWPCLDFYLEFYITKKLSLLIWSLSFDTIRPGLLGAIIPKSVIIHLYIVNVFIKKYFDNPVKFSFYLPDLHNAIFFLL